jgi:iron(III) transport system permease protein
VERIVTRFFCALAFAAVLAVVAAPVAGFVVYAVLAGDVQAARDQMPGASALLERAGMTALVAAAAGMGALAAGVPAALLVERTGAWRGRSAARVLMLLPLAIPPYLHAVAWIGAFGGGGAASGWLFSPLGTSLVLASALWPCAAWAAGAGLRSVDPRLEAAARLAAGPWAALRRVTLPLAARHAVSGALLAALLASAEVGVPAIFGTPTLAAEIYLPFSAFRNPAPALPLAVVLLTVQAALAAAALAPFRAPRGETAMAGASALLPAGKRTLLLLIPAAAGIAMGLILPVAALVRGLGSPAAMARAWEDGASDLGRTLGLAAAGAAAATALALAARLAFGVKAGSRDFRRPGMGLLRGAVAAPAFAAFALPGAVVGIGLIFLYNRPGLPGAVYGSAAIIALAYAARCFWIPWAGLGAAMGTQGTRGVEAARVAGLPAWRVAMGVRLPALRGEIAGFGALAFLFCFGELGSVLVVYPPGVDVLPRRIFDLIHYGYDAGVAGLSLLAAGTAVAAAAFGAWAAETATKARRHQGRTKNC